METRSKVTDVDAARRLPEHNNEHLMIRLFFQHRFSRSARPDVAEPENKPLGQLMLVESLTVRRNHLQTGSLR